jgi:hypothetical protein
MKTVFVLQHSYDIGDREEVKMIGVYASAADAEAAVSRLRGLPGFKYHPDGFHIDAYQLGEDHWQEGFITLIDIMMPLLDEGIDVWRSVEAEMLPGERYRILTQNNNEDEHWLFATGQVVLCEERILEGELHLVAVSLADDTA